MSFEEFLMDEHAKDYQGCDDDMPDAFDNWVCTLEPLDWLKYGEQYGNERALQAIDNVEKALNKNWGT